MVYTNKQSELCDGSSLSIHRLSKSGKKRNRRKAYAMQYDSNFEKFNMELND